MCIVCIRGWQRFVPVLSLVKGVRSSYFASVCQLSFLWRSAPLKPCSVSQRCALAVLCAMDLSALATAAKSRGLAHTNPQEQLSAIAPAVTAILDDIQRTSEGTTEKVESLLKLLVEHGLCWIERLTPWKVGIDKDNRNGLGVDPVDAHKLGVRLLCNGALGWSLHALESNALCAQLPPDGPERDAQLAKNKQLIELADGMMANILETIEYVAGAGNHATTFANAANAQCKTPLVELQSKEGNIDKPTFVSKSRNFAESITVGWHWVVLHWRVPVAFPTLMAEIQESRNATSQVQQPETEPQILKKMEDEAERQRAARPMEEPDWHQIQRYASRSNPICAPYVGSMLAFCKTQSGGEFFKRQIHDLDVFIKVCQYGDRRIGGQFWEALGKSTMGGAKHAVSLFRCGLIKAHVSGPIDCMDKHTGVSTVIAPKVIDAMGKDEKCAEVKDANALMQEYHALFKPCGGLTLKLLTQHTGQADARMVLHVAGIALKGRTVFKSVFHICEEMVAQCNSAAGEGHMVSNPFCARAQEWLDAQKSDGDATNAAARAKRSPAPVIAPNALKRDNRGNLVDPFAPCRGKGFAVGKHIKHKRSGAICLIIEETDCYNVRAEDGSLHEVGVISAENEYVLVVITEEVEIEDWAAFSPAKTLHYNIMVFKSDLVKLLQRMYTAVGVEGLPLRVFSKPKKVVARDAIPMAQLRLVPFTTKIMVCDANDKSVQNVALPACAIDAPGLAGKRVTLHTSNVTPDAKTGEVSINPYWYVAVVGDSRDANMKMITSQPIGEVIQRVVPAAFSSMKVPIMVATADVAAGQELKVFIPKEQMPSPFVVAALPAGGAVGGGGAMGGAVARVGKGKGKGKGRK